PVAVADRAGIGAEVRQAAAVEERLALAAGRQQLPAAGVETAVQASQEGQRRRRQQRVPAFGAGDDLDAGVGGGFAEHCGHGGFLSMERNPNIRPGTVFDNTVFSMLIISLPNNWL